MGKVLTQAERLNRDILELCTRRDTLCGEESCPKTRLEILRSTQDGMKLLDDVCEILIPVVDNIFHLDRFSEYPIQFIIDTRDAFISGASQKCEDGIPLQRASANMLLLFCYFAPQTRESIIPLLAEAIKNSIQIEDRRTANSLFYDDRLRLSYNDSIRSKGADNGNQVSGLCAKEELDLVLRRINKIFPEQTAIMLRGIMHEDPQREVAEDLGISYEAFRSTLQRARKKLSEDGFVGEVLKARGAGSPNFIMV